MKSFSPAGMTQKGLFGRGARTFGNPDGATRGGGAYFAGGANPNGPNQGGGAGPSVAPFSRVDGGVIAGGDIPASVVVLDSNNALVGTSNGDLLSSTDAGASWTLAAGPPVGGIVATVGQLIRNTTGSVVLAMDLGNGIAASYDSGQTWHDVTPGPMAGAFGSFAPRALGYSAVADTFFFFAIDFGGDAVVWSTSNGGLGWSSNPVTPGPGSQVQGMSVVEGNGVTYIAMDSTGLNPDNLHVLVTINGVDFPSVLDVNTHDNGAPTVGIVFTGSNAVAVWNNNDINEDVCYATFGGIWALASHCGTGNRGIVPPFETGLVLSQAGILSGVLGSDGTSIALSTNNGVNWASIPVASPGFVANGMYSKPDHSEVYEFGFGILGSVTGTQWSLALDVTNQILQIASAAGLTLAIGLDNLGAGAIWKQT